MPKIGQVIRIKTDALLEAHGVNKGDSFEVLKVDYFPHFPVFFMLLKPIDVKVKRLKEECLTTYISPFDFEVSLFLTFKRLIQKYKLYGNTKED